MANEVAEFHRNYEHCFFRIKLKNSGQLRAFYLTHVDRLPTTGESAFWGKTVTRTLQDKTMHFECNGFRASADPIIAASGFVNVNLDRPTAIFLNIGPNRQYRKSLCLDDLDSVSYLRSGSPALSDHLSVKGEVFGDFRQFLIRAVAHQLAIDGAPIYRGIRGALAAVESGEAHSLAISRFFAVSLHREFKTPVLWHRGNREGIIYNGIAYVGEHLMPFRDFFLKRFEFPIFPIKDAPKQ